MNRAILNRYKPNKKELALLDRQLNRLYGRLEEVEEVSGKVSKSSDDWPYIEEHMTVRMADPKAAAKIKDKIRVKESRRQTVQLEVLEVEGFIESLPDGIERQIFEMVYLEGMSQGEVGEILNLERSGISKKISGCLKDSQHSHF